MERIALASGGATGMMLKSALFSFAGVLVCLRFSKYPRLARVAVVLLGVCLFSLFMVCRLPRAIDLGDREITLRFPFPRPNSRYRASEVDRVRIDDWKGRDGDPETWAVKLMLKDGDDFYLDRFKAEDPARQLARRVAESLGVETEDQCFGCP